MRGGGARPNPEGGRNLKKWGKSTFFLENFRAGGGGELPPSPPPCVRACIQSKYYINSRYRMAQNL